MSKLNPTRTTSQPLMEDERLAGGYGVKAEKETDIQLLRRAALANRLWEDIAYMDGKSVSEEMASLITRCTSCCQGCEKHILSYVVSYERLENIFAQ